MPLIAAESIVSQETFGKQESRDSFRKRSSAIPSEFSKPQEAKNLDSESEIKKQQQAMRDQFKGLKMAKKDWEFLFQTPYIKGQDQ